MFRELLTKLVYSLVLRLDPNQVFSLVLRLDPNQVFRLEIDRPPVPIDVTLLLLLSKCNTALSYILSVIYTLSEGHGLVLIQLFLSIYGCLQMVTVLFLGRTGLIPLKELERDYPNTLIV